MIFLYIISIYAPFFLTLNEDHVDSNFPWTHLIERLQQLLDFLLSSVEPLKDSERAIDVVGCNLKVWDTAARLELL